MRPGAELEIALLLAGTAAARERAAPRIAALAADGDLARLRSALEARRLLALLGQRLLPLLPARDDAFAAAVEAALTAQRAAGMLLAAHTRDVAGRLAGRGIAVLPLKGTVLAERAHGDVGLRAAGDIDLLVRREDLHPAAAALRARGYGAPRDRLGADGLPLLHLRLDGPGLPTVELHHRIHWHESAFSDAMLERSTPGPDGLLVAEPADELACLLACYARDGFGGLRLLADITAWWDRHAPAGAAGLLDAHLRRHPELAPTWRAAARVTALLGGVPEPALATLPAALPRRETLAVRLASWSQSGDHDQLAANTALVDALLSPPHRLRAFLRRELDAVERGAALHLAKSLPRWGYALARVARGPWDPLPAP